MNGIRRRLHRSPALRSGFGAAGTWIATDFVLFQFGWAVAWIPLMIGMAVTTRTAGVALASRRKARLAGERQQALRAEEHRLRPLDQPTGMDVVRLHPTHTHQNAPETRGVLGAQGRKPVRYSGAKERLRSTTNPKPDLEKEFSHEPTRTPS